ncbi:MAG: 4-alpha-glucanotransferase [Clostridia bacterium]|nr:4-alpha-glucanotransferase [Clostridia bacterium]
MEFKRSSGVLLPMFSLPSRYGIGTMGKAAYKFIDFLARCGQSWWQMLPVEATGYGNSPYYCMDAFKSNTLLLDLDMLAQEGLIKASDVRKIDWGSDPSRVDYDKVIAGREKLFEGIPEEQLQDAFRRQWNAMKEYAHSKGIGLIGDIPIYVPAESKDVKDNPGEFLLDENGVPTVVAGVPPDAFSEDGQLWGNALYNWEAMKKNGYNWWIRRIGRASGLFDMVRIDHFRGFAQYWAVPYGETTAKAGHWEPGPGIEFVNIITSWFRDTLFIAEDLGVITQDVGTMLKDSGLPGMKVLEFAFDPDGDSEHLPHNHSENCVCYIGTHDNCTVKEWVQHDAPKRCLDYAKKYLHITDDEGFTWGLIRAGMSSPARLFVAQMQDYLGLGAEGRINRPGTVGGNWEWRMTEEQLKDAPVKRIKEITKRYKR